MNIKRDRIAGCIIIVAVAVIIGDVLYNMATGSTPRDLRISADIMPVMVMVIALVMLGWAIVGALAPILDSTPQEQQPRTDA